MEINSIYEGDNLEIMSKFPDKSIDLIYADPPFFSHKQYEVIWKDKSEIRSFEDRWEGGIEHYITWMEPRLRECHRVLKDTGSMYLHCDWHADAHLRILMDKIFGENNFRNEIVWSYESSGLGTVRSTSYPAKHDIIFWYSKGKKCTYNPQLRDYKPEYKALYVNKDENGYYREKWRYRADGTGYKVRQYMKKGVPYSDVWEIESLTGPKSERMGYPTQKPVALLERIVATSSNKNDIVFDPFCGCGTALVASQKLGRRWIGIDISPTACKLMKKRLQKEFSISAQLIKGEVDLSYVKKLQPFEFQNWVVVDKFLGTISRTKSGDMGIDGLTPQITGGYPIQVKQSVDIGRNVIDNFETAMRRMNKKKGYVVAFSFGRGAVEEVARVKNQESLEIILRTVQDLLDGKIE